MQGKFSDYLLVSDMDATLLNDDHIISEENRQAIDYFIKNGGRFTVATGRMVEAVRAYMPNLHINAPAVLQDRKSTRLNSSHIQKSRMPSSA